MKYDVIMNLMSSDRSPPIISIVEFLSLLPNHNCLLLRIANPPLIPGRTRKLVDWFPSTFA